MSKQSCPFYILNFYKNGLKLLGHIVGLKAKSHSNRYHIVINSDYYFYTFIVLSLNIIRKSGAST